MASPACQLKRYAIALFINSYRNLPLYALFQRDQRLGGNDTGDILQSAVQQVHQLFVVAGIELDKHGVRTCSEVTLNNLMDMLQALHDILIHRTTLKGYAHVRTSGISQTLRVDIEATTHDDTTLYQMLNALMKKANVQTVEELQNIILDDDSLYEDEAEKMGMPVEAYKQFKKLQDEHDAAIKAQEQSAQDQMFRQHLAGLVQQGEELKKTFPNFNIYEELQNPTFRRLTSPSVGLKVEDAYFAIHRNELTPQLLGYGMQKARQQMSQTIQAQQARPAEGAMQAKVQAADVKLDPRTMSRKEREAIRRRVHAGEKVTFD